MNPSDFGETISVINMNRNEEKASTSSYGVVQADKAVTAASEASVDTEVESISFKMNSVTIELQETEMLQILVLPASSLKPVSWSSSNPSVVLVDAKGRITGKQDEITVTVSGAEKSEITETPASSEDAAGSSKTIYKGSDYSLKVKGIAYNKIQLTWKKLSGVSGYEIYRSEKMDSGYKMIRTVSGSKTTYSDSNRTTGKKYYYRIRAYYKENSIKYCSYSSGVSVAPKLATPSVKVKAGKRKITLSWKKISGANGYVIYRSSKKNGTYKRIAVVKSGKAVKYINTKLPAKKKYYYKVKAYRKTTSGKKVCSSASKCAGTRSK